MVTTLAKLQQISTDTEGMLLAVRLRLVWDDGLKRSSGIDARGGEKASLGEQGLGELCQGRHKSILCSADERHTVCNIP